MSLRYGGVPTPLTAASCRRLWPNARSAIIAGLALHTEFIPKPGSPATTINTGYPVCNTYGTPVYLQQKVSMFLY
jgi:hypothetical protein